MESFWAQGDDWNHMKWDIYIYIYIAKPCFCVISLCLFHGLSNKDVFSVRMDLNQILGPLVTSE